LKYDMAVAESHRAGQPDIKAIFRENSPCLKQKIGSNNYKISLNEFNEPEKKMQ